MTEQPPTPKSVGLALSLGAPATTGNPRKGDSRCLPLYDVIRGVYTWHFPTFLRFDAAKNG